MALTLRHLALLLSLFSWFFCGSKAATGGPVGRVSVKALWLGSDETTPDSVYLFSGKSMPSEVTVGVSARGEPVFFDLVTGGKITVLRKRELSSVTPPNGAAPHDPLAGFERVGEVSIPSPLSSDLLLLLHYQANSGAVRGMAFQDDTRVFPPHTVKVANFSTLRIKVQAGNSVQSVDPGQIVGPFKYPVVADPNIRAVPSFPFRLASEQAVIRRGKIDAWFGSRTFVIIYPPEIIDDNPQVIFISDRPVTVPPEAGDRTR